MTKKRVFTLKGNFGVYDIFPEEKETWKRIKTIAARTEMIVPETVDMEINNYLETLKPVR